MAQEAVGQVADGTPATVQDMGCEELLPQAGSRTERPMISWFSRTYPARKGVIPIRRDRPRHEFETAQKLLACARLWFARLCSLHTIQDLLSDYLLELHGFQGGMDGNAEWRTVGGIFVQSLGRPI